MAQVVLSALALMRYQAIAPAAKDLLLGERLLKWCATNMIPLVVTTQPRIPGVAECSTRVGEVTVSDQRVGVMNLVSDEGLRIDEVRELAARVRSRCDHLVLVSHLTPTQTEAVLGDPGLREHLSALLAPAFDDRTKEGDISSLAGVTAAPFPPGAQSIAQLDLGRAGGARLQHHRVTEDIDPSPQIAKLVASYLRQLGGSASEPVPGVPWTMRSVAYQFAPAAACRECHPAQHETWLRGPHAASIRALKLENRTMPECMVCHSEYFRRTNWLPSATEEGGAVECSACHGDGVVHALTRDPARVDRTPSDELCRVCHTPERSPAFDPPSARTAIEH